MRAVEDKPPGAKDCRLWRSSLLAVVLCQVLWPASCLGFEKLLQRVIDPPEAQDKSLRLPMLRLPKMHLKAPLQ